MGMFHFFFIVKCIKVTRPVFHRLLLLRIILNYSRQIIQWGRHGQKADRPVKTRDSIISRRHNKKIFQNRWTTKLYLLTNTKGCYKVVMFDVSVRLSYCCPWPVVGSFPFAPRRPLSCASQIGRPSLPRDRQIQVEGQERMLATGGAGPAGLSYGRKPLQLLIDWFQKPHSSWRVSSNSAD